jgi:hypothetical protein
VRVLLLCALLLGISTSRAAAQAPSTQPTPEPGPAVTEAPVERELNVIALPTTRSLKRHGAYFRLTHRFTRDLRTLGNLVEDLFGLDSGAITGLEFRFAPTGNLQFAVHRTNLFKDLQFAARYDAWREDTRGIGLSVAGSIEGDDNFRDHYQPTAAIVLSRSIGGDVGVLYASPTLAWNTPTPDSGHEGHDHEHEFETPAIADADGTDEHTAFIGLGARVRLRATVFVAGEYSPRVSGYRPDRGAWGVAIEKHTRGHVFQINATNSFATTVGQLARGGDRRNVYLGFNLARTF